MMNTGCTKLCGYKKAIASYSLLFLCTGALSFSAFFFAHKTFVWIDSDGFLQWIPWLAKLHYMLADLIGGKGISLWSFDIGLGADTAGNLNSLLFDPFNYVAAAFPVALLDIGYTVSCVLKLYTAGAAVLCLLLHEKCSEKVSVLGALGYAYSYWGVGSIQQGSFLVPFYLFPLIILGVDKILKNEKPYVFILSVAFSLMQSVYFTYMSACMSCIFFFLRVLLDNRQPKQGLIIIKQIFRIFFCVCLACFIAAPALVPAFYTLMNANKSSGVDFSLLPTKDQIENWLLGPTSFVMISGNYSWTGTNALMLSMVPFMFKRIREKGHRTPAAAFFLYYLMAVLPAWNSLMNGFSYPVGRWCYGLALFYVWAGAESLDYALQNRTGSRKTAVIWCLFLSIVVLAVYGKPTKVSPYLLMSFINIVFAFFFLFHLWKIRYIYLAAALVLNIGITFILVYLPAGGARIHQFGKIGAPETAYMESSLRAYSSIKDSDFFRVDYPEHVLKNAKKKNDVDIPSNEPLYWRANTLTAYNSTLDYRLNDFYVALENGGAAKRRTSIISCDNRTRLSYLLGVKYYLLESETENDYMGYLNENFELYKKRGDIHIYRSKAEPSLGYVFDSVLDTKAFERLSALDKEQALMDCVVTDEETGGLKKYEPRSIITELPYKVESGSQNEVEKNKIIIGEEKNPMYLLIPEITDSELFVSFDGLKKGNKDDIYYYISTDAKPKMVFYRGSNAQAVENGNRFLTNLGYYQSAKGAISISFKNAGTYEYNNLKVFQMPKADFEEQAAELSGQRLRISEQKANYLKGTVNAKQDGILFLSLVYNPGWKVYIDGERQDTFITDICFTGVRVSAGEHEVVLKYRPVGFHISILMFFTGIVCIIGIEWYYRKRRISDLKECKAA